METHKNIAPAWIQSDSKLLLKNFYSESKNEANF